MVAINRGGGDNKRSTRGGAASVRITLILIAFGICAILFSMEFSIKVEHLEGGSSSYYGGTVQQKKKKKNDAAPVVFSRKQQEQCRYFLAESAIPRSGLGIYTAIDIKEGGQTQSMPDICLYVADTPKGTQFKSHSWSKSVFRGTFEGGNPRAACEGVATLVNTMPDGVRTSYLSPMAIQTNGGLERSKHPGAGAISHYYGVSSVALRDVKAGSEITIDYGDWKYKKDAEYYKAPHRPVEWLRDYGMCIDNIEIRTATEPSMGRGAFASRSLEKGTSVAPAPLQTYPERSKFADQKPEALFVNYCFQPRGTGFMLFPYGPGVNLINHNGQDPNVGLRWSDHHMNHAQWLNIPLNEMWEMSYPGSLILDVYALRDIEEGEELFMDYGPEWEEAWTKHVREWKPLPDARGYVYPADMDRTKKFRTVQEQKTNPYPKNLATVCPATVRRRDEGVRKKWEQPDPEWETDHTQYCNIIKRRYDEDAGEYMYEVSVNFDQLNPDKEDERKHINYDVPHRAILFADKPYTSDLHLPNAFRHPIGFPEELVPEQWRT